MFIIIGKLVELVFYFVELNFHKVHNGPHYLVILFCKETEESILPQRPSGIGLGLKDLIMADKI